VDATEDSNGAFYVSCTGPEESTCVCVCSVSTLFKVKTCAPLTIDQRVAVATVYIIIST
jgi:hypothetical protein